MCGIFGLTISKQSGMDNKICEKIFKDLFVLSESRGKEASGFALSDSKEIKVFKAPFPASEIVKMKFFKSNLKSHFENNDYATAIGHSRLVTHGYEQFNKNNQPIIKNNMVGVHNGIIVNEGKLWEKYCDEKRISDLDSELIPTLIHKFYHRDKNLKNAVKKLYSEIYGMTSFAFLFADIQNLLLATNNGSLYYIYSYNKDAFIFASERIILKSLIKKNNLNNSFDTNSIFQLKARQIALIDIFNLNFEISSMDSNELNGDFSCITKNDINKNITEIFDRNTEKEIFQNTSLNHEDVKIPRHTEVYVQQCKEKIDKLVRCNKCILPVTFPFIEFDEKGVCNYCNNYTKNSILGEDSLKKIFENFRSKNSNPDCLLPFSGGRDSSYTLHYVKHELKMNPIAFSYDWGVITDLARRNQARMCDKLGIEHILVSADLREKRANIKKNVLAWLRRPNLGTIPLFMAGDKQYFYHSFKISKAYDLNLTIMGENHLEKTGFKTAFSGARQTEKGSMAYNISNINKIRMTLFYLNEYIKNPSYINSSLIDTIGAFVSYYIIPHDYLNIYNYIKWDEQIINNTLLNQYDWETDPGTHTTWRIGDGTAAFYNYIYYMVAGFTENDTFRSNQIREGNLSREEALELSIKENKIRWSSIKWYCDTIQIDFEESINRINSIKTLY